MKMVTALPAHNRSVCVCVRERLMPVPVLPAQESHGTIMYDTSLASENDDRLQILNECFAEIVRECILRQFCWQLTPHDAGAGKGAAT